MFRIGLSRGVGVVASRKCPVVVGLLVTAIAMTAHSGGEALTFMSAAMFS